MPTPRKKIVQVKQPPEGLFYFPSFISSEQEKEILHHVEAQPFEPYDHHGYKANREVVYFGLQGGYNGVGAETKTSAMPPWLMPLQEKCAGLVGLAPEDLQMALVARYAPGAGIGWHRDRPQFGPTVFGISLGSNAEMRFRRFLEDKEEIFKITLERGSAYLISGAARSVWQHGMNAVKQLRYSITFRTIGAWRHNRDERHNHERISEHLRQQGIAPALLGEPTQLKLLG